MLPQFVTIKEVGPRDGLQNERQVVPINTKLKLISMLKESGVKYIEATSFVHPKWIPQLSDADDLLQQLDYTDAQISALVPNQKGLERAEKTQLNEIAVFISSSEIHNEKNLNKSIDLALKDIESVINDAPSDYKVRAYVSMVFGSPFGDDVPLDKVIEIMQRLFDLGVYEISLGDTTGMANPLIVEEYLEVILQQFDRDKIAMHFHDTNGMALANIYASLNHGIHIFDGSVGGLGGCPYAAGASGNVATEDVVYMLHEMGIETGIQLDKLVETADYITREIAFEHDSNQLRRFKGAKTCH